MMTNQCLPARAIAQAEDCVKLRKANTQSAALSGMIKDASNSTIALEAIAHYLNTALKAPDLGASASQFVNLAVESICLEGHIDPGPGAFSLEQYKQNPQLALESALDAIGQKIQDIWEFIKQKLAAFFMLLAEKMDYFKRNMGNLTRQLSSAEARLAGLAKDSPAKMSVLKPSAWFIDLIYLDKGFPKYAQGVAADLDELLSAHASVFKDVIAKQVAWLKANHADAAKDENVLAEFKVKTSDFLMLDARPMDRSIRISMPADGNVFYRSRELAGGKAIFTQIEPHDRVGLLAIDMLGKIGVGIDEFDPVSYDKRALQIAEQTQADWNAWYYALPVEKRTGTTSPQANYNVAIIAGTGRKLHIGKDLVFETLPLEQAALRLAEVKRNLQSIREWYDVVFGQIWKDKDFDYLASSLISASSASRMGPSTYVNPAPRHLGNLVLALLRVMANATEDMHTYAFQTCGALLNYTEESLKQYQPH